jgi:hypothetical protein
MDGPGVPRIGSARPNQRRQDWYGYNDPVRCTARPRGASFPSASVDDFSESTGAGWDTRTSCRCTPFIEELLRPDTPVRP